MGKHKVADSTYTSPRAARYFGAPRTRGTHSPLRNDLAILLVWLITLICVAIWVRGGGLVNLLRGGRFTVTALAGLSGWVAALMFLFQVLLTARIPFVEFGFGRDRIMHWHRKFGFWSFWAVLAHMLFMSIGYAIGTPRNLFSQFWQMVRTWPGMVLAAIATGLIFIFVILMSVKSVRSKMLYERWHLWHLLAYPAVLLAIPHMIWAGATLSGNRAAVIFWITLWALTILSVLLFRVIVPIVRSNRHDIRVAEVIPDGSRGVTVKMIGKDLDQLNARGGSFYNWRFLDGDKDQFRGHPFSISMPPTNGELQVAVRVVGDGTQRIANLKPGTKVFIEGPMGRINGDLRLGDRILAFGAGAGVGPMIAILGEQDWGPGEAILVTRDNVPEETMMIPEITELIENRGLIWHRLVGGIPTGGSTWLPPGPDGIGPDGAALIRSWIAEDPSFSPEHAADYYNTDVFVCGPPIWMKAVKADLERAGVAPSQIHIEEFAY